MEKGITLEYMPMKLERTSCTLVFLDPRVGEMVYQIELTPEMPHSMPGSSRLSATLDETKMLRWEIPIKNEKSDEAEDRHYKRLKQWFRTMPKLKEEMDVFSRWKLMHDETRDFSMGCDTKNILLEDKFQMQLKIANMFKNGKEGQNGKDS